MSTRFSGAMVNRFDTFLQPMKAIYMAKFQGLLLDFFFEHRFVVRALDDQYARCV